MTVPTLTATTTYRNFIAGEWVASAGTRKVDNLNPADTRQVLGQVVLSTREEARSAIEAAKKAFPAWRATPAPQRGGMMFKVWELFKQHKQELAELIVAEEGKSLADALGEVQRACNVLEFAAGHGRRLCGKTIPSELPNTVVYTVPEPLGVVSVITPWNFPVAIPVWKIAPALVAGNTVVFKPATVTPATAVRMCELFAEAGLPAGVLNLVIGSGGEVGDELVNHPAVHAVSFTGSTPVGLALNAQAAAQGKKVQCEMGGKNAIVVLSDADLDLAAESTVQGAFWSSGQRCTATSRAVVEASVADRFVELVVAKAKALKVGAGLAGVQVGPLVDKHQYDSVCDYLAIGKGEAKLVLGGDPLTEGDHAHGYFVPPTVFDHVTRDMRLAQEEIFGPVLSVLRVKDFDEAIEVANDSPYGLSSSVYTSDSNQVFRFVDRIETGITHVNSPTMGGEAQVPFGGNKATGVGNRECGAEAFDFYTELKAVYIDYTGAKRGTNLY